MSADIREIAHRAAARVFAERGRVEHPVAHPAREAVPGVDVVLTGARPSETPPRTGRALVTAECLASTASGGSFAVPEDAVVTPLALEEAQRRGIRLATAGAREQRRIGVGSDHGGFALKKAVLAWLAQHGHLSVDFGTRDENAVDYPDFARAVAEAVASGQCELGIVVDGAGIGSAIAANKVPGVRAATCCDVAMAKNAREHNFANMLALGGKGERAIALEMVATFLATPTGEERHRRRVEKINEIERRYARAPLPRT